MPLLQSGVQIIAGLGTAGGVIFSVFKWIITPMKKHFLEVRTQLKKIEELYKTVNEKMLPIINSLDKEFSVNSGKSIKDQINRIDNASRLSELRSKLIASNIISYAMIEFDIDGNYTWGNNTFLSLLGSENDELLNNNWIVGIEEDDRQKVWDSWKYAVKNRLPFQSEFNLINNKTNIVTPVRCMILPHKSQSGMVIAYYGILTKIVPIVLTTPTS